MLTCQKDLFDIPDEVNFINCAYMSPALKSSIEKTKLAVEYKAHPWDIVIGDFFEPVERARELFAQIISGSPEQVALVPSTSYGISLAAKNIPTASSKSILVLKDQFPSNIYPWMEMSKDQDLKMEVVNKVKGEELTELILDQITTHTHVVAVSHAHWEDGTLTHLQSIGERCREVGAYFVVDGTQSIGCFPFDVEDIQPDFLVTSSYKWLLGPYGLGFLYCSNRMIEGQPLEFNWINRLGSEDFSQLVNYTDQYQPGARRFDMGGKSNVISLAAITDSLEQILKWGVKNISEYCGSLSAPLAERVNDMGYFVDEQKYRVPHIIGIQSGERELPENIGLKLREKNIFVSQRGNSLRISPYLYNGAENMDQFVEVLGNL